MNEQHQKYLIWAGMVVVMLMGYWVSRQDTTPPLDCHRTFSSYYGESFQCGRSQ